MDVNTMIYYASEMIQAAGQLEYPVAVVVMVLYTDMTKEITAKKAVHPCTMVLVLVVEESIAYRLSTYEHPSPYLITCLRYYLLRRLHRRLRREDYLIRRRSFLPLVHLKNLPI